MQVKVTLSPGLSFASSNLSNTTISGNTAIWRAGDLLAVRNDARRTKTLSMPVNLSGSAPLERRCLTAEIVQVTPPDSEDWSFDDVATVCLGDGPPEVIDRGEIDLFKYVPCIGVTTYPCSTDDTLELVAEFSLNDRLLRLKQRRDDTAAPPTSTDLGNMYLQPESVIIHVKDPQGRHDGKWRTGTTSAHSNHYLRSYAMPGVGLLMELIPSGYSQYTYAISDVEPKQRPGAFTLLGGPEAGGAFLDADTRTSLGPLDLPESTTSAPYALIAEFSALGTHKVQLTFGASTSGTAYTDTVTYTFHVGPMAELEVRDAGASPAVARGKVAYTIEAVNNGPDATPAEVTLTGVPEGAVADPSRGSYAQGACQAGLCEGVWAIGQLESPEIAPYSGRSPSATLTITAEGDPVTATIESVRDYTVCIDSDGVGVAASSESACEAGGNTWHTAEYYDHIPDNNRATIASHAGTGEGHPDAPAGVRVVETPLANIIMWQPVETVNGHKVSHYEVQRSASPWTTVARDVGGTIWVDMAAAGQLLPYRVRAMNEAGGHGPDHRDPGEPDGERGRLGQLPGEAGRQPGLAGAGGPHLGRGRHTLGLPGGAPGHDPAAQRLRPPRGWEVGRLGLCLERGRPHHRGGGGGRRFGGRSGPDPPRNLRRAVRPAGQPGGLRPGPGVRWNDRAEREGHREGQRLGASG